MVFELVRGRIYGGKTWRCASSAVAFGYVLQGDFSLYQPGAKLRKAEEKKQTAGRHTLDTRLVYGGETWCTNKVDRSFERFGLVVRPRRVSAISTIGARTVQELNRVWCWKKGCDYSGEGCVASLPRGTQETKCGNSRNGFPGRHIVRGRSVDQ